MAANTITTEAADDTLVAVSKLEETIGKAYAADFAEAARQARVNTEIRDATDAYNEAIRERILGVPGAEDRRDAASDRRHAAIGALAESEELSEQSLVIKRNAEARLAQIRINYLDDLLEDAGPEVDEWRAAAVSAADAVQELMGADDALKAKLGPLNPAMQERVRQVAASQKQHPARDRVQRDAALPPLPVGYATVAALRSANPLPAVLRSGYRVGPGSDGGSDDGVSIVDLRTGERS